MEKWEREKSKPVFAVTELTSVAYQKPMEIGVHFYANDVEKELVNFQFVKVQNRGEDTAIVTPLIRILDVEDSERVRGLLSLKLIPPNPLAGVISTQWVRARTEFERDEERFATAILDDQRLKTSLKLHGCGVAEGFALLFTVRGSNKVHLPTEEHLVALPMPCTFSLGLYFQAEDLPLYFAKLYRVVARSWDSVDMTPIPDPSEIESHLRFGYLSFPQSS